MSAPRTVFPDRTAIETGQLAALQSLLATVLPDNRFYAARLTKAGAKRPRSLQEFFRSAPFTSKKELVEDQTTHPPFGSNLTFPLVSYTRFCQTSGTTGVPMRWLDTAESWQWVLDCWMRVYRAAGVTAEDRVYFPFSFGPFLGFWAAFDAATRMGCLALPGGGMRSSARVRAILDNGITVLCSTPTYAVRLAEVAAEEGIDLSAAAVRTIIVAGEPGGSIPATRALIESRWPLARVVDHHGMTEIGPVSYECPVRRGVLHIIEEAYLAEVIDRDTLQPAGPGETGELVLSNLGRTGSPLLRYRTGDVVQRSAAEVCDCGSCELALEGGILGRTDDMLVVRGVNLFPSAVEEVLRSAGGVAEFRVETGADTSLAEMTIQVEPLPDADSSELEHRISAALQNAFALRISVSCVPCGALPRFEGKARRWFRR